MGQLVGHWQEGQRAVLLRPEQMMDAAAVDQTPLPETDEDLAQQLLLVLTVHVEGLRRARQVSRRCFVPHRVG